MPIAAAAVRMAVVRIFISCLPAGSSPRQVQLSLFKMGLLAANDILRSPVVSWLTLADIYSKAHEQAAYDRPMPCFGKPCWNSSTKQ